jgi:UDP-N-acetylglucosamine--N-acetylmuramyl-(pentapeptide) pyrophosphoryl-undecaprenol N-acetylglucosamine transferase
MVMMMAGGTGGHIYPALAVAQELSERGYRVEWMGTRRGLEQRVVPAAGFPLHHLAVRGVRGKNRWQTLLGLAALVLASVQALWLLAWRWPRCVVGMGGYVSGPGGAAAWLLRRPLLIQEQNAVAGTSNRLLAPLARTVVAGFPRAFSDRDCLVLGNPVRRELLQAAAESRYDYDGNRPLRLLVLGGSLGARPLNRLMVAALAELAAAGALQRLQVWHQAGEAHAAQLEVDYAAAGVADIRVSAFIEDMAAAYAWADLVFCRAGALTVSELAVMGRPALLVPLPHAIDDPQSANARYLSEAGAARLLPQQELDGSALAAVLLDCLDDPAALAAMAQAARGAGRPAATVDVCDRCEALIHGR